MMFHLHFGMDLRLWLSQCMCTHRHTNENIVQKRWIIRIFSFLYGLCWLMVIPWAQTKKFRCTYLPTEHGKVNETAKSEQKDGATGSRRSIQNTMKTRTTGEVKFISEFLSLSLILSLSLSEGRMNQFSFSILDKLRVHRVNIGYEHPFLFHELLIFINDGQQMMKITRAIRRRHCKRYLNLSSHWLLRSNCIRKC